VEHRLRQAQGEVRKNQDSLEVVLLDVLEVLVEKQRAIVKGVNIITKHAKPSAKNPQGGIVKQEAAIHISNLSLIDPKSGKATRIKIEREGKTVKRIAKKSGEEIK